MKDLTVILEDRPGTVAAAAEALGRAGINIEGFCGFAVQGRGVAHILVEDASSARRALQGSDTRIEDEQDVVVMEVEDRPGSLGEVTRRVADAGVNLNLVYLATNTRLVLGTDDFEGLSRALGR